MKLKKAVIPIAGKGTRFLPATKVVPKELIPILTRPMIQYVVEEAVAAGFREIVFVTSCEKSAIENYFDKNKALDSFLREKGKTQELEIMERISNMVDIITVRQKEPLGLGHAVLCAQSVIGQEDFAVLLGDDLVLSEIPVTKQLANVYQARGEKSVIGVMKVPEDQTHLYGIVDGDDLSAATFQMTRMVEKPQPDQAPSNLATPGRYILTSEIFDALKEIPRGAGGEYQLTDAINLLSGKDQVFAHIFEGDRFDTGNIKGYLEATIEFALRDPELKGYMNELLKKYGEKK